MSSAQLFEADPSEFQKNEIDFSPKDERKLSLPGTPGEMTPPASPISVKKSKSSSAGVSSTPGTMRSAHHIQVANSSALSKPFSEEFRSRKTFSRFKKSQSVMEDRVILPNGEVMPLMKWSHAKVGLGMKNFKYFKVNSFYSQFLQEAFSSGYRQRSFAWF